AEMLIEPGPPHEAEGVARLKRRIQPRRASAAHEAEMAAVGPGHRLHDRRMFAMPADADDEPFVTPFHALSPKTASAPAAGRARAAARPEARARRGRRRSRRRPAIPPKPRPGRRTSPRDSS